MPAFFSRVFSRGKDKDKSKDGLKEPGSPTAKQSKRASRASAQSLLEGKFEAVSPNVSPTAEKYEERDKAGKKDKEKERLGLFRPKSRTTSGNDAARKQEDVPQLTLDLNLPSMKDDSKKRDLSIVYEGDFILDDAVLGEKRLSPGEALKLIRACLPVLTSRGLETLGVMHPHWHSASPAKQRKIISLFLSSIAPSPDSLATSPTSPGVDFESELEYVRSPHDVAAVFRWALRHLELDGNSFDKDDTPSLGWYDSFTESEKKAEYSRTAYSDLLLPSIKPLHVDLLSSTLNLISRLASHSEANGVSGSKLSMFFGHYLLTGNRLENLEDWNTFYSQWERAGRALEHIFLASLRDEDTKTGIPRRLSELTTGYPYSKHAVGDQFPRPARFATRSFDALYVLSTAETQPGKRPREEVPLPLQIVENAFNSGVTGLTDETELVALWEELRKKSNVEGEPSTETSALDKSLAGVLSDESIRILSLKSHSTGKDTPTITMFTPVPEHEAMFAAPTANGRSKVADRSKSVSRQTSEGTSSSPITTDWSAFSSAGFGEGGPSQSLAATLLDSDLEKTEPPKIEARRSLKKIRPPSSTRGEKGEPLTSPTDVPIQFKTAHVSLVKIDESFIDFWSDALLDPISDSWPAFVICQLKSDVVGTLGDKRVAWLVIEQKLVPPPPAEPSSPAPRASSPRPSVRSETEGRPGFIGRASATFTSRKRFNFFGGSQTPASSTNSTGEKRESRSPVKGTRVNELGEVISEEKEKDAATTTTPKAAAAPAQDKKLTDKREGEKADAIAAGVAALASGAGAAAVAAETTANDLAPETEETKTPAQNGEANEAKGEEPVAEPTSEPESELIAESADVAAAKAATPPPEEPRAAESTAADTALAVGSVPSQSEVEQDKVAEATPSQPELPHDEAPQVDEPAPSVPKFVVVEPTPPVEPAAPAPEASTVGVLPTETTDAEDAAQLTESAEKTADTAVSLVGEAEGNAASVHHGAGDSRFVENIETPVDDESHRSGSTAEPAASEPIKETLVVPETIQEEVSEPAAVEAGVLVGNADESQIAAEQEEPSSVPVAEETIESEPEQVVAPVDEEATEAASEVVGERNEAALDSPSPEPTPATGAEETTLSIEGDVTPIVEDSPVPCVVPAVPASPVAEPLDAATVEESTPTTEEDAATGVKTGGAADVDEPTAPLTDENPPAALLVAEDKDAATTEPPSDDHTNEPDSLPSAQPASTAEPDEERIGESHPNDQSGIEANGKNVEESYTEDESKSSVVPPVSEDAGAGKAQSE